MEIEKVAASKTHEFQEARRPIIFLLWLQCKLGIAAADLAAKGLRAFPGSPPFTE
jgi:hypothetical protein